MIEPRIDNKIIIKAIHDRRGLVSEIAKVLGVSVPIVNVWRKEIPEIADAFTEARSQVGDLAENGLFTHIGDGNLDAIKYYLNSVHRSRGYGNHQQVEHTGNVGVSALTDEELQKHVAKLMSRAAPTEPPVDAQ